MNNFEPLVSIIIPVFNGSNYVKEAIDSTLNQTYKNIEIIVVNDGSTDNTEEIVKSYGDKVRYFYKGNGGVSSALNLGIKESKGEYISWLSHDDLYKPNKIERQIKSLKYLDDKQTIIYSDYDVINERCKALYSVTMEDIHEKRKLNNGLYAVLNGLLNGCTLLIHKSILYKYSFNESLKYTQDYDLWFRIFSDETPLLHISEYLVKNRVHDNQNSKNADNTEECDSLWINILSSFPKEKYDNIFGSEEKILRNILPNIKSLNYKKAIDYIENRIDKLAKENKIEQYPKITTIITCYNQHETIDTAINSVLNQNYPNLEIIIIDDCSSNINTINKLKNYEDNNLIKVIFLKENKGVSHARNIGLDNATGEFIQFLDGDDYLLEGKFYDQINQFYNDNTLDVSYTNFYYYDVKNHIKKYPIEESIILNENKAFEDFLSKWQHPLSIPIHTFLFKKHCFNNIRFREDFKICEDYLCWLTIAYNNYNFKFLNKEYCVYNINYSSHSQSNIFEVVYNVSKAVLLIEEIFIKKIYFYYGDSINFTLCLTKYVSTFYNILIEYENIIKKQMLINKQNEIKKLQFILFGISNDEKYICIYLFGIKLTFKKRK